MRWINIRDVHRRILKKNVTDPVNPPRQYKYEAELGFMKPFYKDVVVLSLDEEDEDEEKTKEWDVMLCDTEDIVQTTGSDASDVPIKKAKAKKRKSRKKKELYNEEAFQSVQSTSNLNEPQNSLNTELDSTDPVDAFLLSIGATLKTFSPYHLNVAKSKIFAVVQEHDLQQIVQNQNKDKSKVIVTTSDSVE